MTPDTFSGLLGSGRGTPGPANARERNLRQLAELLGSRARSGIRADSRYAYGQVRNNGRGCWVLRMGGFAEDTGELPADGWAVELDLEAPMMLVLGAAGHTSPALTAVAFTAAANARQVALAAMAYTPADKLYSYEGTSVLVRIDGQLRWDPRSNRAVPGPPVTAGQAKQMAHKDSDGLQDSVFTDLRATREHMHYDPYAQDPEEATRGCWVPCASDAAGAIAYWRVRCVCATCRAR